MTDDSVRIVRRADWVVAAWSGDIDRANAGEVEERSVGVVLNSDAGVVVDLTETKYLDSAGMAVLVAMNRALRERQQVLRVVLPDGSMLEKALRVAGLTTIIPFFASVDAALAGAR